jgi:hypothetical protein
LTRRFEFKNISKYVIVAAREDLTILNALTENHVRKSDTSISNPLSLVQSLKSVRQFEAIYNEEFIFSSIMRQQIEPATYQINSFS